MELFAALVLTANYLANLFTTFDFKNQVLTKECLKKHDLCSFYITESLKQSY